MKYLNLSNKVKLDNKFSNIFCDDIYVYLQNKNNKFLQIFNHNLEGIETKYVFLDYDSICFDTFEKVFYVLKFGQETIIRKLDKDFNTKMEKILKLNTQPLKISYNEKSKGLYLYTENSILEFNTEKLKLTKIINPYEESYSPIVNNNFDFNLWEKHNNVALEFNGECKILDVTSHDNTEMFLLTVVDNAYYIYKCKMNYDIVAIDNEIALNRDLNISDDLELFDFNAESILEDLNQSPIFESYLRGSTKASKEDYFDDYRLNCYKSFDEIVKHNNDKDCGCKKHRCTAPECNNHHKERNCNKKHHFEECKDECVDDFKHEYKPVCCDINKSCCEIIHSVAFVELSISHILNAEGEKIQKVVKCSDSVCEILETNNSVLEVIEKVTRLEDILCSKLKLAKEICDKDKQKYSKPPCNKNWKD